MFSYCCGHLIPVVLLLTILFEGWSACLCATKGGHHSGANSLTRAQSIDSLPSQNMTNLPHNFHCHCSSMRPLRPGHAILPMALFLGMWLSFSAPSIMVVQAATPSEPATADPSTLADENTAAEDDPDENLVPDRKSTRLNSSHMVQYRMPSSA